MKKILSILLLLGVIAGCGSVYVEPSDQEATATVNFLGHFADHDARVKGEFSIAPMMDGCYRSNEMARVATSVSQAKVIAGKPIAIQYKYEQLSGRLGVCIAQVQATFEEGKEYTLSAVLNGVRTHETGFNIFDVDTCKVMIQRNDADDAVETVPLSEAEKC